MVVVPDLHNRKILTLNCQKGLQPELRTFLHQLIDRAEYDFVLLQEANDRVIKMIRDQYSSYGVVRLFNEVTSKWASQSIMYRREYELVHADYYSFHECTQRIIPTNYGVIVAEFTAKDGSPIAVAGAHLRAGINARARGMELRYAREKLRPLAERMPIIFGGDFNNGIWGEKKRHDKALSPHLINVTRDIGPTLSSFYSEPSGNIVSNLSALLGKAGIGASIQVDCIYTCRHIAARFHSKARTLPARISDHSPVEVHFVAKDPVPKRT